MLAHFLQEFNIMVKYALVLVLGAVLATVGCGSNPLNADGVDVAGMQAWASAHALESCILVQGKGVLVPIGKEGDAQVMPISYCNPAE